MIEYHKINSVYKREENGKNFLIGEWSIPEFEYLKNNIWIGEEKLDGCLDYDTQIITDQGKIKIGKIVNQKLNVKVLSYNIETKEIEYKDIEHFHKEERLRDFLHIKYYNLGKGGRDSGIICTDNHKFWVENTWVEAKNIKAGMQICHIYEDYPNELKQLILGTLLGDSNISRPSESTRGFAFSHSVAQYSYFELKKKLLGNLFNEHKGSIGGYSGSTPNRRGSSIITPFITDIILEFCEKENEKYITEKWIEELEPAGWAFLYMDNGSCQFTDKQKPRAHIALNYAPLECGWILCNSLKRKYNIDSSCFDYKSSTIVLTDDGTEKFFSIIAPYIEHSVKYKIAEKYRNYPCVLDYCDISKTIRYKKIEVLDVVISERQDKYQYDLTIKDNSNYFANRVLVHNTNIRILVYPDRFLIRGKTDNASIPTFLLEKINSMITIEKLLEIFPSKENEPYPEIALYSEGVGVKIQKGGGMYTDNNGVDLILFDVKIGNWWLKRDVVKNIASSLKMRCATEVFKGTLPEAVDLVKKGLYSQYDPSKFAEGLVLRPEIELYTRSGDRIITKVKHKDFNHGN